MPLKAEPGIITVCTTTWYILEKETRRLAGLFHCKLSSSSSPSDDDDLAAPLRLSCLFWPEASFILFFGLSVLSFFCPGPLPPQASWHSSRRRSGHQFRPEGDLAKDEDDEVEQAVLGAAQGRVAHYEAVGRVGREGTRRAGQALSRCTWGSCP